jgi:hypothetical protein
MRKKDRKRQIRRRRTRVSNKRVIDENKSLISVNTMNILV